MQNKQKTILIILSCFTFLACQELYKPDDLDNQEKIPVIEGYLTNKPGPYRVMLKWAMPYDADFSEPITGATVIIFDDKGNQEILSDMGRGVYQTSEEGITGIIGNTYTLSFVLSDGNQYQSLSQTMPDIPVINNIYATSGKKEIAERTFYGDIVVKKYEGLNVYIDILAEGDNTSYYRFSSKYLTQYRHFITVEFDLIPVYCPEYYNMDDLPNVKSALFNGSAYEVKQHDIGFISYIYDPFEATDMSTAPMPVGWVTSISVYKINEEAYYYYQSIVNQLAAEEQVFDPIPTQITGNIKCITDSTKIAMGFFEVAAVNTYYTAFFWHGSTDFYYRNLPEYVWPKVDTCTVGNVPDYWVTY